MGGILIFESHFSDSYSRKYLEYIKDVIDSDDFLSKIKNKIIFNNLNIDSITQEETNLDIMLTEELWNNIVGETVLYFETDSMLCPNSKIFYSFNNQSG